MKIRKKWGPRIDSLVIPICQKSYTNVSSRKFSFHDSIRKFESNIELYNNCYTNINVKLQLYVIDNITLIDFYRGLCGIATTGLLICLLVDVASGL